MPGRGGWREITVEVDPTEVDALSGALWAAGVAGIEERTAEDATTLVVAAPVDALDRVLAALRDVSFTSRPVPADEGLDGWREHAVASRVAGIVVQPAWRPEEPVHTGEVVVRVDPGRAFGSGTHVTTRLAIELLVEHLRLRDRVLDLGTGSGVLSVIAAKLGAAHVLAVDIEADAREVARQNIERNEVQRVVAVAERVEGEFDLVVVNITAPTLVELHDVVLASLVADGRLVSSGILTTQVDDLVAAYGEVRWLDRRVEGDWVALVGRFAR